MSPWARAHGNRIAVRVFSPEGATSEPRLVARSPAESTPPLQGSQGHSGLIPVGSRPTAKRRRPFRARDLLPTHCHASETAVRNT